MNAQTPPTFRDFAGHVFGGDRVAAEATLATLLGLTPAAAAEATAHFQKNAQDPTFLPRAMALRTVVAGDDDGAVAEHLTACFGFSAEASHAATAALRLLYPRSLSEHRVAALQTVAWTPAVAFCG